MDSITSLKTSPTLNCSGHTGGGHLWGVGLLQGHTDVDRRSLSTSGGSPSNEGDLRSRPLQMIIWYGVMMYILSDGQGLPAPPDRRDLWFSGA